MSIFSSTNHISGPVHYRNGVKISSLGNNILHLLYILHFAKRKNIDFFVSRDTQLENIFDLSAFKKQIPADAVCLFAEEFGAEIDEFVEKDKRNNTNAYNLLNNNISLPENFWVEGWFYNYSLMPTYDIFKNLKIKQEMIDQFNKDFSFLEREDNLSLHYRGTDFQNHAIGWGDMRLPQKYFTDSLEYAKQFNFKTVNIFSDQKDTIIEYVKPFKSDFSFNLISNDCYMDWLCLHKSKCLIASNSSFCWTASLYNKKFLTQPKNYLLYNFDTDKSVPTDIYIKESKIL